LTWPDSAGATTDQAGGYTDFSMLLTRGDGQQRIARLQFKTPPGLLGVIAKVPLCGEPQATVVLQGDGVTVELVGSTFIKNGITSTTFKTVPDVPFNNSN
jgi:hypothetical protein